MTGLGRAAVGLVWVVGLAAGGCGGVRGSGGPAGGVPVRSAVSPSAGPHHDGPGLADAGPSLPPTGDAVKTAALFAEAWVRRGLHPARWWAGVSLWCAPGYAAMLRTVDPVQVPASEVTGRAVLVRGGVAPVVRVPTDAGVLTVRLAVVVDGPGGPVWRVVHVELSRDVVA